MSQRHFWIDGMTTRHTENLQVRVLAVTFIHLQIETQNIFSLMKKRYLCSSLKASHEQRPVSDFDKTHRDVSRPLTSSSCCTACCLAFAMMPSSSWKRRSISVRRSRAFCCSRRMRSSCFLPCSSAMQGLCCHCWMR